MPPRRRGAASSALDAVELMDVGWNFRREHLRLAQRSHYVITNGGDQPNVVPPNAAVWYYFREADYDHIMDLWHIGDNMAQGRDADDRYDVHVAPARQRVAGAFQQADRRGHVREYPEGRPAALVGRRSDAGEGVADGAESSRVKRPGDQDSCHCARRARPSRGGEEGRRRGTHRRRLRRYRRRVLDRADRDAALSLQHSRRPGPQLGQRISMATPIAHKGVVAGAKVQAHDDARYPAASGAGRSRPGTTSTTCRPRQ